MMLGLTFAAPLLLIGLLAAGIPFLLHLLYRVRAQDAYFPSLRFLRAGLQRTARRRRIQHWLLLAVRSLLLALLAVAVAEPVTRLAGGWLAGRQTAAVIVLDDSLSMATEETDVSRLARAKSEAATLLSGDARPALAAVLTASGKDSQEELTGRLEEAREALGAASARYGPSGLPERVAAAVQMLAAHPYPRKAVYVFSDFQRRDFEAIAAHGLAARTEGISLFVVDCGGRSEDNAAVVEVAASSERVVGQAMQITAAVRNYSPEAKLVDVSLRTDGSDRSRQARLELAPAGQEGHEQTVRFSHRVEAAGLLTGEVSIESDQADLLVADDTRGFCFRTFGRVRALVVAPPGQPGEPAAMSPSGMLQVALDPYAGRESWPIEVRTIEPERFSPRDLRDADIVFLCEVGDLDPRTAESLGDFVAGGRTAMIFPGPATDRKKLASWMIDTIRESGPVLFEVGPAVGQLGPDAEATLVDWADLSDPLLQGLYANIEAFAQILVQRSFTIDGNPTSSKVLLRLASGHPLLLSHRHGDGRWLFWTVPASPRWSNLPISGAFLPIVNRACLLSRSMTQADPNYASASQVPIRLPLDRLSAASDGSPPDAPQIEVIPPGLPPTEPPQLVSLARDELHWSAVYTQATTPGLYRWQLADSSDGAAEVAGAFAVWPDPAESDLRRVDPEAWAVDLSELGHEEIFVGSGLAAVHEKADQAAEGRNWWDLLLAAVLLLLVAEALVANRRHTAQDDAIPARLKPGALR